MGISSVQNGYSFLQSVQASGGAWGNIIFNKSGGNVGIGTISPTTQLHIAGAAGPVLTLDKTGVQAWRLDVSQGTDFRLWNASVGAAPVTVLSSGNVGIGTTTPSALLTVDPQGAGGMIIGNSNTAAGGFTSLLLKVSAKQNGYSTIESIQSSGSALGNLFINPNGGNVGIGVVDTKGYKFAVNGSAIATSMTVKAAGTWPDYVFKKDYQLPSLQEVKAYIDQNQHLPEIPSEQQIAKEGLNLGEMNKILMKKVEELTLYLIQKEEQLKKQQVQIEQQQQAQKAQDERLQKLEQMIARDK